MGHVVTWVTGELVNRSHGSRVRWVTGQLIIGHTGHGSRVRWVTGQLINRSHWSPVMGHVDHHRSVS